MGHSGEVTSSYAVRRRPWDPLHFGVMLRPLHGW